MPVLVSLFSVISTFVSTVKKGLSIMAIPITCLKVGLYTPDRNSPTLLEFILISIALDTFI